MDKRYVEENEKINLEQEEYNKLGFVLSGGYKVKPGSFLPYGVSVTGRGVGFSINSKNAYSCTLYLFHPQEEDPYAVIPFPELFKIGDVYSMVVYGIDPTNTEYAYKLDGPFDPSKGLLFNKDKFILDPYAKLVAGQHEWGIRQETNEYYRGSIVLNKFDWGSDRNMKIPSEDLIIYEMHVRGFTKSETSDVKNPGTFDGIMEKIPYLKELGINAVELMPIFEFDECADERFYNDKRLLDYWGYNTVCYFAPNSSYAAAKDSSRIPDEFRDLVKALHQNGIEVILDVVFNHTAEGNEEGPYISFKGLDNNLYYMLTPDGKYYNFSGCGNTLNCNNPIVNDLVLNCLRYWVINYRVDGFRFDLASILGRDTEGNPMTNPPILERVANDPILSSVKLIAEAWDAAGLYQVGSFPNYGRWAEINGKYRDIVRCFLKGDAGYRHEFATRIIGSPDLYQNRQRSIASTVNFITCHDGFTLMDLYSYNTKHNEENGWNNTDGDNNNNSWNCGEEGESFNKDIISLRKRLIKNAITTLMISRGAALLRMGDEFGNSQYGNNNAYCQDNEISWLNWEDLDRNRDIFMFFKTVISFRNNHSVLRGLCKPSKIGLPSIYFTGNRSIDFEDYDDERVMGLLVSGYDEEKGKDDILFIAINMHWDLHHIKLYPLPNGHRWHLDIDTSLDIGINKKNIIFDDSYILNPRSIAIFTIYDI